MGRPGGLWLSLPVCIAACACFIAAVCLIWHHLSPVRQGKEMITALYKANRAPMLRELAQADLTEIYEAQWNRRATGAGREALSGIGIPHVLLFQEMQATVERTSVVSVELEKIEETEGEKGGDLQKAQDPAEPEEDGAADGSDAAGRENTVSFRYRAEVDFYLEKGNEGLTPVERKTYSGTIRLKRGWLPMWKLDGITIGG